MNNNLSPEEIENRFMILETKLAFLEDFLNKLQDIAVEQGNTIDILKKENKLIKTKITELLEEQEGDIPNRRPPHY